MLSLNRYIFTLSVFVFVLLLLHAGFHRKWQREVTNLKQNSEPIKNENNKQVKTIQWFDRLHNNTGLRNRASAVDFNKCDKKCKLLDFYEMKSTTGSEHGPLQADAVLFQGNHLGDMTPPLRRDEDQVFVFAEREPWLHLGLYHSAMSPSKPHKNVKESQMDWYSKTIPDILRQPGFYMNTLKFRDVFNWTMTYRNDSDIPMLYGKVLHMKAASSNLRNVIRKSNRDKDFLRIFNDKKLNVVWLVSHCRTDSKREEYVDQLKQYIDVDIYGKCGQDLCPKHSKHSGCLDSIIKKYRFVLAFENTFYKDYVTEKLFDWYSRDIVPVVYGMADYRNIVPDNTVINAADFASPEHLADYLKYVGSNRDVYMKYMRSKKRYFTVGHYEMQQKAYCKLCSMLHNLDNHRKSYSQIDKWWKLNDTSGYIDLYHQAVPPTTGFFTLLIMFVVNSFILFVLFYMIYIMCTVSRCRTLKAKLIYIRDISLVTCTFIRLKEKLSEIRRNLFVNQRR